MQKGDPNNPFQFRVYMYTIENEYEMFNLKARPVLREVGGGGTCALAVVVRGCGSLDARAQVGPFVYEQFGNKFDFNYSQNNELLT